MASTSEIYDEYHKLQDSDFARHFQDRILKDFPKVESVLDFGCGRGHAMRRFREAGVPIVRGCDVSRVAANQAARQPSIEPFWVYCAPDLLPLPYKDKGFDMVFSADVLEHLAPMEASLAVGEMKRVCKKWLVLSICFREAKTLPELGQQWHLTVADRVWWEKLIGAGGEFNKLPGYDSDVEPNLFVWGRA